MSYKEKYNKYKAKYLLLKAQSMEGGKKDRPSPSESATKYEVGERKVGNDGNMWEIVVNKNGVKRWKKVKNNEIDIVVVEKRGLKIDDVNKLSKEDKNYLGLNYENYEEHLVGLDYMIFQLKIDGKICKLIHGFPGDNPAGIFYINNEKAVIIYSDGEPVSLNKYKSNKIALKFSKWYENKLKCDNDDEEDCLDYSYFQIL